jgi:HAD superfamily hydrolase (TIGR01509 family)
MSSVCVVFDFDGTILDTESTLYQAWAEVWDDHGHSLAAEDWVLGIGTDNPFDPWHELELRLGRPIDPEVRVTQRLRRDELQAVIPPRPGIERWLTETHELGIPVGVASSSSASWVEGHLTRLGMRTYFSCVVGRSASVPAKPRPDSYLRACEELGADPSYSVAVEDSPHGVSAARSAGLFTIAVPHSLTISLDLSAADLVVDSLERIPLSEALQRAAGRLGELPAGETASTDG